jgi:hypothetical protein
LINSREHLHTTWLIRLKLNILKILIAQLEMWVMWVYTKVFMFQGLHCCLIWMWDSWVSNELKKFLNSCIKSKGWQLKVQGLGP